MIVNNKVERQLAKGKRRQTRGQQLARPNQGRFAALRYVVVPATICDLAVVRDCFMESLSDSISCFLVDSMDNDDDHIN